MNYNEYKQLHLPTIDKEILEFWKAQRIFEQSVEQRDATKTYVFYEGPPSANGKPGIHHVMARAVKDVFCRYQTLQGCRVERKGGWDTHGLPIELSVEKELGITKEDIGKKISVDDYNRACKETVMRYKNLWDDITVKMGYWVDLDNPYITFENDYIESCWALLKILYEKKTKSGDPFLYKGFTIQPFSPAAGTGLSSHELNMPGTYREVTDISVIGMFKVKKDDKSAFLFDSDKEDVRIMAWTTTPWTLPSNVALTVGPDIVYVKVKTFSPYTGDKVSVILAKERKETYFPKENDALPFADFKVGDKNIPYNVDMANIKGSDLVGVRYEQLMPGVSSPELEADGFRVIAGNWVTTEDGTGVVHTAPYFGADDFKAAKEAGVPFIGIKDDKGVIQPLVDRQGRFVEEVPLFGGKYVKAEYYPESVQAEKDFKSTDLLIALHLKEENKAFRVEKYKHTYPHCWRTDKPVLYYPLDSWFIRASAAKERMVELNNTINWKPANTGTGRFGAWLENLQDWNLSRSRYWGVPLPIWRTESGSETLCIGSKAQLQEKIDEANAALGLNQVVPADYHRPYIDDIVLVSSTGERMVRELDLIDVWFDSGAMPYAQWHFPFENQDKYPFHPDGTPNEGAAKSGLGFPASFIAEGVDQTRGWFYTLHAIGVMCFDSIAFKNVVSNGLVLDKNGQKMSKRLGNAVDPFYILDTYGADATRWYMLSNAAPWENLKFDESGITESRNKFFGTLFNTYNFFALYANLDGFNENLHPKPKLKIISQLIIDLSNNSSSGDQINRTVTDVLQMDANPSELDRWILSKLNSLIANYCAAMDDYEPTKAARFIETFVDEHLSNWYVRLSRRRFWKGELNTDKLAAYQTLYQCLLVTSQLSASLAPFFSDWLYRNLTANTSGSKASVHLTDMPVANEAEIDQDLEKRMDYAQRICSLALSIRKKEKIRVRLPLQKILLPVLDESFIAEVEGVKELILSEINVKELEYITDASGMLKKKAKANFKSLGGKLGKDMKAAGDIIAAWDSEAINKLEKAGSTMVNVGEQSYEITPEDLIITAEDILGWKIANDGDLTVALDVTLTENLIAEGVARDLVNRIQNMRKEKNLNVTDRIAIDLENHESIHSAVSLFGKYIQEEVLAKDLNLHENIESADFIELSEDLNLKIILAVVP